MIFVYIILFGIAGYLLLRLYLGATGDTTALDSRIKMKLNLYNEVKKTNHNLKKIDIYKRVIHLSKGFENREEEVLGSALNFRKFISSSASVNFQDIVYIMMEEEFHPKDISLAGDIFAKIRERVDEIIPKEL
jgi:hypothetical protein